MTKIDIYSGFLGAGKTTLIKKMIKEAYHGQKLVLIENEFGEIGIDGGFLQEAGIQITEMNSGCICCSLVGDFGRALKKVIAEYAPDRILIEPSGVGKLSDVIGAVRKVTSDDVQLGNFVTVADATKCKMYMKNFGEFYNNQIETANTIILSRTDGMKEEKLDQCVAMIREHNKDAVIVTTPWPELTGEQLMEAMEQRSTIAVELAKLEEEAHHHHHDHDDDDDEDGGEATLSEQNLYRRLSEYYDLLEDLDNYVRGCAQNFNGSYLEEDRTTRQNLADVAERTEDTIEQYYDIVEDLDVPTSSKNYSSWKDIIALYDDLDHRIDAICDAWEISLKYDKPADHKNEIVAPLSRDNVAGTNDNKYRLDFEGRYPGAKPVEVN